jgi:aspartate/methionine/tyrosine aminotransferase
MKFDFGFGDSFTVRDALYKYISPDKLCNEPPSMGYANKGGYPYLEQAILNMVVRSTGKKYKHCILTTGAYIGAMACMQVMSVHNGPFVRFDDLYFMRYPFMVRAAGLTGMTKSQAKKHLVTQGTELTASPSNPLGEASGDGSITHTIWDAAYHSEVYTSMLCNLLAKPKHKYMVGSLGKTTGLNGIRLGWIACDSDQDAEEVRKAHYSLTLGVSTVSVEIAETFFREVDVYGFFKLANSYLNDNRTELQKLEYLFARPVPKYGMFWFTELDVATKRLLDDTGVTYVNGSECGGEGDTIRITIGQTRELTKKMVKAVSNKDGK